MSYTLTKLMQGIYLQLGQYQLRNIDSATTTTITDDSLASVGGQDDSWKDGGVFIQAAVEGNAPDGEFRKIGGYLESTGQFSFEEAFSGSPASGDKYGLVSAYYPIDTMVKMANAGLRQLGAIPLVQEESIQIDEDSGIFISSTDWKRRPPFRVDVEVPNSVGQNIVWQRNYDWEFSPSLPGIVGKILFSQQYAVGQKVRVWTMASHPILVIHSDLVAEVIDPVLAEKAGVVQALTWQNARLGGGDAYLIARLLETKDELEKLKMQFPIWRPTKVANHLLVGV